MKYLSEKQTVAVLMGEMGINNYPYFEEKETEDFKEEVVL